MKTILLLLLTVSFACPIVGSVSREGAAAAESAKVADSGVNIVYENWAQVNDWADSAARTIPVKLYIPKQVPNPLPVVVFSHGLGGSREAAVYLGTYWAQHGYVCVFIQHPGSDESFWKPDKENGTATGREEIMSEFMSTVKNPMHAFNRVKDVHFVLDELAARAKTDPALVGKLNLNEIAIAGHSYGAWTALTASGQRMASPNGRTFDGSDPRIKAGIFLSPPAPKRMSDPRQVFGDMKVPGLHFTGTIDDSPVNDTKAAQRRIPYDSIENTDQYLVTLDGGDHMIFNGRTRGAPKESDAKHIELIELTTTAFLDAYIKKDPKALAWLQQGGAARELKPYAKYELKIRTPGFQPAH